MEVACYVGIDVAKDRLDVHLRPIAKCLSGKFASFLNLLPEASRTP